MKRIFLSLVIVLSSVILNAQIKPPQQTDTLIITSVKYNYAQIRQENWPCRVIYKSTTSFRIGEDVFTILDASKSGMYVEFRVTDKNKTETYTLLYNDYYNDISISFSGYEFKCKIDQKKPNDVVDVKPSFFGGDANLFSMWVNQRLVYPKIAKENGVQGRVTLQFTVEKDGTVTKVKVLRGVDPSLDKEAVRVVSSSPKWKPALKDGEPVAVTYTFPVIFQLS